MRYKGFSILMIIWLAVCRVLTFFVLPNARLIRLPVFFRNSGSMIGCNKLTLGFLNRIDIHHGGVLTIGCNVQINDFCHIGCANSIIIGDDALIASRVFITDHDHYVGDVGTPPNNGKLVSAPVSIGKRVWIGEGVAILKGVTIGDDVIIGANSVVTRSFPSYVVLGGVPARVIRHRQSDYSV